MRAFGVMGEWPKDWSRTCGKACVGFLGLCLLTGACGKLAGLQVRDAGLHDARASRNDASVADALVPADLAVVSDAAADVAALPADAARPEAPADAGPDAAADTGTRFRAVALGVSDMLALESDGALWGCGSNGYGELGDGSYTTSSTLVRSVSSYKWQTIAAGQFTSVGIRSDGTLWAWGRGDYGMLGIGREITTSFPTQIGSENDWQSLSASDWYTMGLKTDGILWAWGDESYGEQSFDGGSDYQVSPTQVSPGMVWRAVSAGCNSAFAIRGDGTLWAWGVSAAVGSSDASASSPSVPVQVGTDKQPGVWPLFPRVKISSEGNHEIWSNQFGGLEKIFKDGASAPAPAAVAEAKDVA